MPFLEALFKEDIQDVRDVSPPQPYTLHPAPSTLNPAPCTLHPEPCTLHHAPCRCTTLGWEGEATLEVFAQP